MSTCFQLKADFAPLTVLKFTANSLEGLENELEQTLKQAPQYFNNAPIIIDVGNISRSHTDLALQQLHETIKAKGMLPIGVRGLLDTEHSLAKQCGLAIMTTKIAKTEEKKPQEKSEKKAEKPLPKTMIIDKPVRTGSQIYAKNADLLILASVNPGAEVLADGNIHIYGALRGRALAGVHGDTNVHIFCKEIEAEMVSIAGFYTTDKTMGPPKRPAAMQHIFLKDNKICVDAI